MTSQLQNNCARGVCALVALLMLGEACSVRAQNAAQQTYLQCLTNFETYAESIWHTNSSGIPDAGYWGDGGNSGNGGIRGNSGIAVAYAVLCIALPDDPKFSARLTRVRQALNYDYNTHFTGGYNAVGGKWGWGSGSQATCTSQGGADWQSGEWAGSMGLACVLVQSNLPAGTVTGVQMVVASEADHRASIPPCTRALSDGDTKAEENGWDANILALAAAWMTNEPGAGDWLDAAKSYCVNTYTVAQADLVTPNTNGDALASWVSTVTLFPSYALKNHGFYHPTYEMVAGMSLGDSLLMARMANPGIAAQLQPFAEHNVLAVWTNNLNQLLADSGDFAYPQGVDWSVRDFEHNSFISWLAAHFNDPLARYADNNLSQCVRHHQVTNGDGTFVGTSANPGGGILFYREAVEARRTAIAWLHWSVADHPTGPMTAPTNVLMYNTDVQVIHQHSPFGTFSVSFNSSRIMAMVEPSETGVPTNVFISSPRLPGIMGLGALGNPTAASLINFATNAGGFTAQIRLTNPQGTTEEYIKSTGESLAIIEVPTLTGSALSGGSFICGIENDALTGGSRFLEWTTNSATMTALSGASRNITNNWLCISGRFGMAAGPAGYFRYAATNSYRRVSPSVSEAGEAEDTLSFVENSQLGPRYAVWFPSKNALQVSNAAAAITWTTNLAISAVTLTFPGTNGVITSLSANIGGFIGAWNADTDGLWSDSTKWNAGIIPDGNGFTADFSAVNMTAAHTVTLDTARAVGVMKFGGAQNWTITNSGGSALTLANGSLSPAISVTNTATLAMPLAGANGLTKSGPGTLVLSGNNSLSGTLNVDSTSTTANDGALRIASSASVANVSSPIKMANNNGGGSTLQLDGAQGEVNISQDISLAGRNVGAISIQNLAGSNTLAGNFILTSGGGNYWFDCDDGTLALAGQIPSSAPTVPNARTLAFIGPGDFVVSGPINNANGFNVSLVKSNSGTLRLNGTNTCTGAINVNNGTLAGTGTIPGPVTLAASATLAPGGYGIGTLTINNALTNNGAFRIRLNRTGAVLTNDNLKGISTLAFGGPLQLVLLGDPITVSNSFKIFSATNYRNFISAISPAAPGTNLLWITNNLAVNGTLSVALGTVKPQIGGVNFSGANLVITGGGGAAGYNFSLLSSTNVSRPLTNWAVAAAGFCDSNGNFTATQNITPGDPQLFYVVRVP